MMNLPVLQPFQQHDAAIVLLLPENYDPNGKHIEFKDMEGKVFARMTKVYKKGGFLHLFPVDNHVHAELRDEAGTLLMTSTSYRGDTARECKVELHLVDGRLFGTVFDAPFGVDFEAPDGKVLGRARRAEDLKHEPREVDYTYTDEQQQVVGSCERRVPPTNSTESLFDLLDFITEWDNPRIQGSGSGGMQPVQKMALTAPVEPTLHTLLHLFPALQHLRFSRNW